MSVGGQAVLSKARVMDTTGMEIVGRGGRRSTRANGGRYEARAELKKHQERSRSIVLLGHFSVSCIAEVQQSRPNYS